MANEEKTVETAPSYSQRELLEHAEVLFGVKPEVLAGALHGKETGLTIAEAKSFLDKFLKRKVN